MAGKTQIDGDQIVAGSITDLEISTIAGIQIGKISINGDLLPDTDNTRSLGSATNTFANLFLKTGLVMQQTGAGLNAITIKSPASLTSYNLILPDVQGGASTVLTNDGTGTLSWAAGGSGSPAGSDTQVQFNNAGAFGASPNFTFTSNNFLTITSDGSGAATLNLLGLSAAQQQSSIIFNTNDGSAILGQITGEVIGGSTSTIAILGSSAAAGPAEIFFTSLNADSSTVYSWTLNKEGGILLALLAAQPATPVEGELIYNSTSHGVQFYNGTTWVTAGGGSGSPAGSSTQIQFNTAGSFDASANLSYIQSSVSFPTTGSLSQFQITEGTTFGPTLAFLANTNGGGIAWLSADASTERASMDADANGGLIISANETGALSAGNAVLQLSNHGTSAFVIYGSGQLELTGPTLFDTVAWIGNAVTEDPLAVLELGSTTQGFLPPRMTAAQRDAILGAPVAATGNVNIAGSQFASSGLTITINGIVITEGIDWFIKIAQDTVATIIDDTHITIGSTSGWSAGPAWDLSSGLIFTVVSVVDGTTLQIDSAASAGMSPGDSIALGSDIETTTSIASAINTNSVSMLVGATTSGQTVNIIVTTPGTAGNSITLDGGDGAQITVLNGQGAPVPTTMSGGSDPSAPTTGLIIFNTDSDEPEFYNGTSWVSMAGGGGGSTPTIHNLIGTDEGATLIPNAYYFCNTASGVLQNVNLPDATTCVGQFVQIELLSGLGNNTLNVNTFSSNSQTIDGNGGPAVLNSDSTHNSGGSSIKVISDGANWQIEGSNSWPNGVMFTNNGIYALQITAGNNITVATGGINLNGDLVFDGGGASINNALNITATQDITFGTGLASATGNFAVDATDGNITTVNSIQWQETGTPMSPGSGVGIIYYDTTLTKFQVSENGGAFQDLVSTTPPIPITQVTANVSISTPGFYLWTPGASNSVVTLPNASTATGRVFYFNALQTTGTSGLGTLDGICSGPDSNLWFTEQTTGSICKMSTSGVLLASYPVPTLSSVPFGICSGPDGNLWFTEQSGNNIGRCTTSGVITEFPITTSGSAPAGICAGPDGNLWFCETVGNNIGQCTTSGVITEFPVTTSGSVPQYICVGSDNNLWFTESSGNNIGTINTSGVILNEFPITTPSVNVVGICAGPDNNLWFTEQNGNNIGQCTTSGVITEFPITTSGSGAYGIVAGTDSNLWFTELNGNNIGRCTTSGVITEFTIPTGSSFPLGICSGSDNNLWFCENIGQIGQCTTAGVITEFGIGSGNPSLASVSGQTLDGVNITSAPRNMATSVLDIISDGSNWFTL